MKKIILTLIFISSLTLASAEINFCAEIYGKIPDFSKERITLTVESSGDFTLPDTSFQKRLSEIKKTKVKYQHIEILRESKPEESSDYRRYLSDSRLMNLDDGFIRNKGDELKKTADPVYETVSFVHSYITDKDVGIGMIPAAEIVKQRSGDCTEHAILTAAILRSAGIPSRALYGMVFTERFREKKNCYVFHMWCEAYYNGRWIIADAALPGTDATRYIAFGIHNLKSTTDLEYLETVSSIEKIKVIFQ